MANVKYYKLILEWKKQRKFLSDLFNFNKIKGNIPTIVNIVNEAMEMIE